VGHPPSGVRFLRRRGRRRYISWFTGEPEAQFNCLGSRKILLTENRKPKTENRKLYTMPLYDQVELLCQAILSQGREEAEKIRSRAREQAEALVAAEEARSREVNERTEGQVRAQAEFAARSREDRAALVSKREIAEAKEVLLGEIFAEGLERLRAFRQTPDYQEWLHRALARAVQELQGDSFRIVAHPEEARWLTPELLEAVGRETGTRLELETDADTPPGGCIAIRADGQMRYDLTFQGIIDRQRERLRTELARRLWGS